MSDSIRVLESLNGCAVFSVTLSYKRRQRRKSAPMNELISGNAASRMFDTRLALVAGLQMLVDCERAALERFSKSPAGTDEVETVTQYRVYNGATKNTAVWLCGKARKFQA